MTTSLYLMPAAKDFRKMERERDAQVYERRPPNEFIAPAISYSLSLVGDAREREREFTRLRERVRTRERE